MQAAILFCNHLVDNLERILLFSSFFFKCLGQKGITVKSSQNIVRPPLAEALIAIPLAKVGNCVMVLYYGGTAIVIAVHHFRIALLHLCKR